MPDNYKLDRAGGINADPIILRMPHRCTKKEADRVIGLSDKTGGVLLSHAVAHAVPSALKGLTSVFGMGTGVSPSP